MRKIIWFPIETLEERYSGQWNRWFKEEFSRLGIENLMVYGTTLRNVIKHGSFLDVISTNYFKADQLKQFCWLVEEKILKDDDIILVHDGWFPGIEMLAYIRDALDLKFKIYAIFHAGTYDPCDFITQKGMRHWGKFCEASWFEFYDGIFVATEFHKKLILEGVSFLIPDCNIKDKIHVTGLPIYPDFVYQNPEKVDIVVFPHRLDPEKQPEMFDKLASDLKKVLPSSWSFIKSKDYCKNKWEYYHLLNSAKISVSCALQETWGIAMIESVMCGCVPIVPDRLSYKELYPRVFRYDDFDGLIQKVRYFVKIQDLLETLKLEIVKNDLIKKGSEAIQNMVNIMMEK